jgi:hypothetical protein
VSSVFLFFTILTTIGYLVFLGVYLSLNENSEKQTRDYIKYWLDTFKKFLIYSLSICIVTWALYVFCPSKKDALIIVAGGAVGNFITSDSSARQIPSELTLLVREEIRSEISRIKDHLVPDTLQSKTKEELIEMYKNKR